MHPVIYHHNCQLAGWAEQAKAVMHYNLSSYIITAYLSKLTCQWKTTLKFFLISVLNAKIFLFWLPNPSKFRLNLGSSAFFYQKFLLLKTLLLNTLTVPKSWDLEPWLLVLKIATRRKFKLILAIDSIQVFMSIIHDGCPLR